MLTGMTPDVGSQVTAQAQGLIQKNIIIPPGTVSAANPAGLVFPAQVGVTGGQGALLRTLTYLPTRGLPRIRVSLFQYPYYDRGDFIFQARNNISWRLVAPFPGARPTRQGTVSPSTDSSYTPITTPQLLLTNQVVSVSLPAGGVYGIAVEFALNSLNLPNQGYDRVLVSISAA
jgi:hypothetical protein